MIGNRADIPCRARPIHEGWAVTVDIMMMQLDGVGGHAEAEKVKQGGEAVLAAAERHDEAPVGAEVGAGDLSGHAASRIWSAVSSEAARPVARNKYPAAASALAAAVMMARESLRSTFNHEPM